MSRIMPCMVEVEDGGCHAKVMERQEGGECTDALLTEKEYFAREKTQIFAIFFPVVLPPVISKDF